LIGTATINHDDLLFARESLETANGPNDMRCFVQRWNDDAYAHITLKANRLNFSRYHAQGAAATAFAAAIGGVAFSASTLFQYVSFDYLWCLRLECPAASYNSLEFNVLRRQFLVALCEK
jgi:hypothetical protein